MFDDLQWVWDAFQELRTCRSVGFGPGPIPWTAIMAWGAHHGIEGDELEELLYLIRGMDREELKEEAKQPSPKPGK